MTVGERIRFEDSNERRNVEWERQTAGLPCSECRNAPCSCGPGESPEPPKCADPEPEDDYDGRGCFECGGRGYFVDCIDDLCHGQDECIHGDPPSPCRVCNPKGEKEDGYL